jgi:hypothetical protein
LIEFIEVKSVERAMSMKILKKAESDLFLEMMIDGGGTVKGLVGNLESKEFNQSCLFWYVCS